MSEGRPFEGTLFKGRPLGESPGRPEMVSPVQENYSREEVTMATSSKIVSSTSPIEESWPCQLGTVLESYYIKNKTGLLISTGFWNSPPKQHQCAWSCLVVGQVFKPWGFLSPSGLISTCTRQRILLSDYQWRYYFIESQSDDGEL